MTTTNSKFKLVFLGLLFSLISTGCGSNKTTTSVTFEQNTMSPQSITLKKGDSVKFRNDDSQIHSPASDSHPEHSTYPEFDSGNGIEPGDSWTFTFEKIGRWNGKKLIYI